MRLRNPVLDVLVDVVAEAYLERPGPELADVLQQLLTSAQQRRMTATVERVSAVLQGTMVDARRTLEPTMPRGPAL